MENKELFAPILQEDEEIIKVLKPNKTRYWRNMACRKSSSSH